MRRRLVLIAVATIAGILAPAGNAVAGPRLYEPSYGSPETEPIGGFAAAADGSLSPLAGSPFATVAAPSPVGGIIGLAFTPDGARAVSSYLFDGTAQGLSASAAGALARAGAPLAGASATGLAVTPDGRYAYVPTREFHTPAEGIRGFSIGPDGSLASLGPGFGSGEYGDTAITPDGHFLFATSYATGNVQRFSIGSNGSLAPLGTTPVGSALFLTVSPDGSELFVGLDGGTSDGVVAYRIGADGGLTVNGAPVLTGDVSMGYFAIAPDGRHIYMPDSNNDLVVVAAVGADGQPAVVSSTPVEDSQSVSVSPDGRYLYYEFHPTPQPSYGLGVAAIGPGGSLTPLPFFTSWDTVEEERLVFAPGPVPVASFTAKAAAPGAATQFNATGSTGAARFDWEFGDGTTLPSGGPTPTHVYASPGTYQVTLTVTDESGCSTTQLYTGQSTVCPGGTAPKTTRTVDTLPAILSLAVTRKRFAAAGPHRGRRGPAVGTKFSYRLSEAASVRFKIERRLLGRTVGKSCKPRTPKNAKHKRCALFRKLGSRAAAGKAGPNLTPFAGRLRGRRLAPGPYRVTAVATDAAGGRSEPRQAAFRVLGAR